MEEELEEKVVQILTQVASGTDSRSEEKKSVLAKLRDGPVEQICKCGERLIGLRRYDLAYQEVFYRYGDRATQLRLEVERKDLGDTPEYLKVSVLLRYLLGASYALYLQTIHRDDAVLRSDTVDVLRDALKDVLQVVEIFSAQSEAIREELYWCLYNSSLLAVRMCRWLRLHGFPQLCVQPLWLLVESMHTCLPLMAVHMIPFRSRVMLELAACAEAAKQLGEAARACVVAQEHIEKAKKLETMLPPVPTETTKLFEVQLCRFKLLKLKYDFWLKKVSDVNQLSVQVKEISPQPAVLVSGLLETLKFLHGLPQHFGAEDAKCGFLDGVEFSVEEGAPEVTKFTNVDVQAKQLELLTSLVELIKPLAQKAEAATKDLEEHTVKRLTWEAEAEGRARTDEPKLDEKGEEVPPDPRPQRPNAETLEGMGFGQRMHSLEEVLPMEAHVWLVEECLRQEMRGKEAVKGFFEVLERCLALRLRYRHFLRPPLVDVDVLVSPEADPAQMRLPECYELLTGDLNFYSPSNDPAAMEKLDETGLGVAKQAGKHVYIIGQRFDAWENWTAEYPIPIRRLCNMKLAFVPRVPENVTGAPSNAVGVHEPRFVETDGEVKLPWLGAPYRAAGAGDSSGFEVFEESEQIREALLNDLIKDGLITHRALEVPVDPHPGQRGKPLTPCLFFSVYDEQQVWCMDSEAQRAETTSPAVDATLLPEAAAEAAEVEENSEKLMPPWSPLMDVAAMASTHLMDVAGCVTKHLHASMPNASFNALLRADLRQTPGELQGKPFQSYVFLGTSVEAPCPPMVRRRMRILRALYNLWKAKAEGEDFFRKEEAQAEEGSEPSGRWKRPEIMDRLLEMSECLDRTMRDATGRLFMLSASDLMEDVCSFVFLTFAWPKICYMQDILQQDELKERVLKDKEKNDISEWSHVLRRILPMLLRTLEKVTTVDALTLCSAGDALAQLFLQEKDSKSAQSELGHAIERLERELQSSSGPQARLDPQIAGALSFDPPSLRPPGFALFAAEGVQVEEEPSSPTSPVASPPGSPNSRASKAESEKPPAEDPDAAMILRALPRLEQDRLCLLSRLYERWIDCSLLVHLPHPEAPVRRKLRHNEVEEEEVIQVAGENTSTRLALSTQEANVLGHLGENPYLRCFFFISVAKRRPDVASAALGKAVMEADAAVAQERNLWIEQEKELLRQQKTIRSNEQFGKEFRKGQKALRKPPAHLPTVVARMPGCIQLRLPPLHRSTPPMRPIAEDLNPTPQEYSEALHSKRLGVFPPSQINMTCMVFGKAAGVGTSVSEMHRDLLGTGCRRAGQDVVEIRGLKTNTNYCFATMYFEGFEESKGCISSISATSSPIGAYYPLPLALLRTKLCTAALGAADFGTYALKNAWPPLFESFCERCAPEEEFDSYGLRSFKLRLDVADRFPPAVLSAFAQLVLLRHRLNVSKATVMPCTKPTQRAVLCAANECVIAVDCARRAGNSFLCRQAVSLTLELLARLMCYRTRPTVLLTLLAKCSASLEEFPKPERQLPWHSKARQTVMYLLHQTTVTCVQLRQVGLLQKQLADDLPERYMANPLADAQEVDRIRSLLLDQALELALLGAEYWSFAEKKAMVALQDSTDKDELLRILKELSSQNYAMAKDAAALALREEPERPLFALSVLRCAAVRSDQPETQASVGNVLSAHPCSQALDSLLLKRQEEYKKYGFLLRALPPSRLSFPEPKEEEEKAEEPPEDEATLKPEAAEEEVKAIKLEDFPDSELLSQLELSKAAALMKQLKALKRSRHDISKFRFLDLKQVEVPLLAPDGATLGVYEETVKEEASHEAAAGATDEASELSEWQKQEEADKEVDKQGFQIVQELMRILVRASGYAAARQADQLLQASMVTALNALFLVAPRPEQCVPQGPKSNPMDIDPDKYVGVQNTEESHEESGVHGEADTDLWLSLAVIAEFAVNALQRLKTKLATADPMKADPEAFRKKLQTVSEEEAVVLVANGATKEMIRSADEELFDVWFEKMPTLDVPSVAQLVTFSVLCLYHMRRWSNIIVLCRGFNDATCSVYATTFLPLMIGAQREIFNLSKRAVDNTQRYLAESKSTFEADQKRLPRKLLRQLALQGELSEPEKLFRKRAGYYEAFHKRQMKTHGAWGSLLQALEDCNGLISRAVPAAAEQLRKSRLLLAEFLCEREEFSLALQRGQVEGSEKGPVPRERALRLAASALVSSYRKAVELLRKRQMHQLVVQALHELGNLLWLEGDASGAREAWSDAVDTVFQFPYAIKNWSKCIESSLNPPQDAARVEILLLSVVLLAKHARLTKPKDMMAHLNASLFASSILEAILTTALPNPPRRDEFVPNKHRLREIFFGLRETRMILPPSSVYGGVDGCNFLSALSFFQNTLVVMNYQPARALPICSLYTYVATDVCRNVALSIKGRLLMVQSLIRCRFFTEAWLALYAISQNHDQPRGLVEAEALDKAIVEAQEMSNATPFLQHEEPWSEANTQALKKLVDFVLTPAAAGVDEGATPRGTPAWNLWVFKKLKAEFLITVCSYQRVFPKMNEPQEKERLVQLDKADLLLVEIWKEVTGKDDDREAWSTASRTFRESGGEEPILPELDRPLTEEEGELCAELRQQRAKIQEEKGDLGKAIQEVLYAMEFLRRFATTQTSKECNFGGRPDACLRLHPGSKMWMRLRCAMVHLLISQGRLKAAKAHIQQGLEETSATQHDVCRVELLMAKVRVEVLSGRLLELQGHRHLGALAAAECCLAHARRLPMPTPSAIYARMMLVSVLEQNPSLASLQRSEESPEALEATGGAEEEVIDASEMSLLEAAGSIIISPMAKELQKKGKDKAEQSYHQQQKMLAELVAESLQDVEKLLKILGLQMVPRNLNSYCDFGPDNHGQEAFKAPADPPLMPGGASFRSLSNSDARQLPNIYLELMPLRLHCQLTLAALRLDLGLIDEACQLLQDAELCMTRCVHLIPWQHVQFCLLKLRWRKLKYRVGLAPSAPLDAPNAVLYRDPKTFATCICPAVDSPLYRTFLQRAKPPQIVAVSEWVPPYERQPEEALQLYMQEFLQVARMVLKEGGNDLRQLLQLLDEALEETLRTEAMLLNDPERAPLFQRIFPFFACFAAAARNRKALLFEPPQGAGPPPVEVEKLPLKVALNLQRQLQRQAAEGALAYSGSALETAKKQIMYRSMMRHTISLRRECDLFNSLFLETRLLSDQLHIALTQCCEAYVKARILDENLLKSLETPEEVPEGGHIFVRWSLPDLRATAEASEASESKPPTAVCTSLLVFLCPLGEEPRPLLARSLVPLAALQKRADVLSTDLEHCRPATAVSASYVEQELREVVRVLRGLPNGTPEKGEDERLEAALQQFLLDLADPEDPKLLKSELLQAAVAALIPLLDPNVGAAKVTHVSLAKFLRATFAPLDVFPGR